MGAARRRGITRLEGFSDAVFAFSATLLVVSLEVPDTFSELLRELHGFAPFALSFGALVLIWTVHDAFFRRYGLDDGWTTFLNACLLFVVLFYVYPLKFVARGVIASLGYDLAGVGMLRNESELAGLFLLYGSAFVAIFLCVALMYRHAWSRRAELGLDADETRHAAFLSRHYLVFAGVGGLSIALAWTGLGVTVGAPGWIYGSIGPLCWVHGRLSERGRGGGAAS